MLGMMHVKPAWPNGRKESELVMRIPKKKNIGLTKKHLPQVGHLAIVKALAVIALVLGAIASLASEREPRHLYPLH